MATTQTSTPKKKVYKVASSSGSGTYDVTFDAGAWTCTCPSFLKRKAECKHITPLKTSNPTPAPKPASTPARAPEPTQPKPTGGALSGLFSGKVAAPTIGGKKGKSKVKPISEVPASLIPHAEVMVAGKMVNKRIENKIKAATAAVKMWCLENFAEAFAATGSRPATTTVIGGKAKFDSIQTKRIYLTPDRVQAVRDMNVAIDEWTTIKGVQINYEAIQRHGLEEKLQAAIRSMDLSDAVLQEVLAPKHEVKEAFFDSLYSIVQASLQTGEVLKDKMFGVLLALQPVAQTKNPEIELGGASEDERLADALHLIIESPVASDSDEETSERDDE